MPADAGLAARVDAGALRPRDPLGLALPTHVGLELREDRQHAEEGAAGRGSGINVLLDHLEMGAAELDLVGNVRKVPQRAAQPIETGDDLIEWIKGSEGKGLGLAQKP